MDCVTAVFLDGERRNMNICRRATGRLQRPAIFYGVMLVEGGYPEVHTTRLDRTLQRKPAFWIPGYAENDARLGRFRRVGNLLPT